jgi:hypothetical protein
LPFVKDGPCRMRGMAGWLILGMYGVLVVLGLLMSFRLRGSWKAVAVRIGTGFLLLPGLLLGGLMLLFRQAEPPTLGQLQRDFPTKKVDLETILRMSDEDAGFSRIAPDFLWQNSKDSPVGDAFSYGDAKARLSKARWDGYRAIYGRNGIKLGIQRDKSGDAFIMVDSIGLLNRSHITGYLYCASEPSLDADRYEPCTLHQDKGSKKYSAEPRTEAYSFQRLDGRWFAFDEGPS